MEEARDSPKKGVCTLPLLLDFSVFKQEGEDLQLIVNPQCHSLALFKMRIEELTKLETSRCRETNI